MDSKDNLVGIKHYNLHFKIQPDNCVFNVYGTMIIENNTDRFCSEIPIVLYHQLEVKKVKDINNKDFEQTVKEVYNGNLADFFNCRIYGIESSKLLCEGDNSNDN